MVEYAESGQAKAHRPEDCFVAVLDVEGRRKVLT